MKIYIAGKITGLDEDVAFAEFEAAEGLIASLGHEPLNPMKLVDQSLGREYEEYLLDALRIVLIDATAVYFLPNWMDSFGARIEHAIATERLMPIYNDLFPPPPVPAS